MLAVLRLALGCHFLYEGIWKIRHPDQFVAETEGFLSGARGPMAGMFYAMVPDIDGHQRLEDNLNLTRAEVMAGIPEPTKAAQTGQVVGRTAAAVRRFLPPHGRQG